MKNDPYEDFRALTKEGQREHLLNLCASCVDGAPTSLARKVEIYLGVTPDEQKQRRHRFYEMLDTVKKG